MALTCTPWITTESPLLKCSGEGVDPAVLAAAVEAAVDLLYNATLQLFPGVCEDSYRPCGCSCGTTHCGCRWLSVIEPRRQPLIEVTRIVLDGTDLVAGVDYQVLNGRLVQRIGKTSWPCGQNLELPPTEDDTLLVEYTYGGAPGASGDLAAATLACEFVGAWTGGACRLPKRLTSITQEGVTQAVFDPFSFLDDGLFGVAEIDYFVASVNPDRLTSQGRYLSPEMMSTGYSIT